MTTTAVTAPTTDPTPVAHAWCGLGHSAHVTKEVHDMANLRGLFSLLTSRRGAAGTARPARGPRAGAGRSQDEAIGRGVRKLLRRGR